MVDPSDCQFMSVEDSKQFVDLTRIINNSAGSKDKLDLPSSENSRESE